MGKLLSRFKKQPTTLEKLKTIEAELRKIEEYKRDTERKQKRTVANLVIYGAALYVLACVIIFVWFLPEAWYVRLGLVIPLFVFPAGMFWIKKLISRYFHGKMVRANEDYSDLQKKKTDIIDNIMETETYNKAKEILSKYAPEKLEKKLQEQNNTRQMSVKTSTTDLRKRNSLNTGVSTADFPNQTNFTFGPPKTPGFMKDGPVPATIDPIATSTPPPTMLMTRRPFFMNRSLVDKVTEFLVGDGPSHRMALICQYCKNHNGLALPEEFPYMSFACCFCRKFNPARSKKLVAPRLPDPYMDIRKELPFLPHDAPKAICPPPIEENEIKVDAKEGDFKIEPVEPSKSDEQMEKLNKKLEEIDREMDNDTRNSDEIFPPPVPFEEFVGDMKEEEIIQVIESTPNIPIRPKDSDEELDVDASRTKPKLSPAMAKLAKIQAMSTGLVIKFRSLRDENRNEGSQQGNQGIEKNPDNETECESKINCVFETALDNWIGVECQSDFHYQYDLLDQTCSEDYIDSD